MSTPIWADANGLDKKRITLPTVWDGRRCIWMALPQGRSCDECIERRQLARRRVPGGKVFERPPTGMEIPLRRDAVFNPAFFHGCRQEQDGHCAAAKLGCCLIWKTLEETRKCLENKELNDAGFGMEEK